MATVEGAARIVARFNAIPAAVRDAARDALEKSAEEIVQMMRRLVPVRTGEARASIGWTWGDAPAGAITIGTVGDASYGTQRITIYAGAGDAYHARFLEFGTKYMPAHPFFFPAYRALKRRAKGRITRAMTKAARGEVGAG